MSEALHTPSAISPLSSLADLRSLRVACDIKNIYDPGFYVGRSADNDELYYTGCANFHEPSRWIFYTSKIEPRDNITVQSYADAELGNLYLHDSLYVSGSRLTFPHVSQTLIGTLGTKDMSGVIGNDKTKVKLDFTTGLLTLGADAPLAGAYGLCMTNRDVLISSQTDMHTFSLIDVGLSICKAGHIGDALISRGICLKIADDTRNVGTVSQYLFDVTAESGVTKDAKLSIGYATSPVDAERVNAYPESGIVRHVITVAKDNVGIGNEAPKTKLDVGGCVKATSIILQPTLARPTNPVDGMMYFDTAIEKPCIYYNKIWHVLKYNEKK